MVWDSDDAKEILVHQERESSVRFCKDTTDGTDATRLWQKIRDIWAMVPTWQDNNSMAECLDNFVQN